MLHLLQFSSCADYTENLRKKHATHIAYTYTYTYSNIYFSFKTFSENKFLKIKR